MIDTPFKDAVIKEIPRTGSGSGIYNNEPNVRDLPGKMGGELDELLRDNAVGKAPMIKNPGETTKII